MVKSSMCCAIGLLDSARKLVSPAYAATMVCGPAASDAMVSEATPFTSLPVPMGVVPSRNVTVPLGALTFEETVAVRVVGFLSRTGLAELESETPGRALFTTNDTEPVADL